MNSITELLKQDFAPGCYILVDDKHPLKLYIGADEAGNYALEYRGVYKPAAIKPSSVLGIKHYPKSGYTCFVISLLDHSMLDTFGVFINDLVEATRNALDDKTGYQMITNRYYAWRKMFYQKSRLLDEKEIMGLIGELLYLRDNIIPLCGSLRALASWSGQEKTKKDFSLDHTWYEVKTIHYGKESVRISSLEQLDSNVEGHLIVYQLGRMSQAFDGLRLNSLCRSILKTLDSDESRDIFLEKLANAGFTFESVYDEYVYEIKLLDAYTVTEDFPKLKKEAIPEGISKVQYDLLLATIVHFKEY